jgi:hypothetical protein
MARANTFEYKQLMVMPWKQLFKGTHKFLNEAGTIARFTGRFFKESTKKNQELEEFIRQ